jgi:hypothetical protein
MTGVAAQLKKGGYSTHHVGKWDAGMATPHHTPKGRGYDTSLNYFGAFSHVRACVFSMYTQTTHVRSARTRKRTLVGMQVIHQLTPRRQPRPPQPPPPPPLPPPPAPSHTATNHHHLTQPTTTHSSGQTSHLSPSHTSHGPLTCHQVTSRHHTPHTDHSLAIRSPRAITHLTRTTHLPSGHLAPSHTPHTDHSLAIRSRELDVL